MMLILGSSWKIYGTFDWIAWMWLILGAFTNVYGETFRFKALKLTKATTLQVFDPSCILFQFIFDISVFHVAYTKGQYWSLFYLAVLYIFQALKSVFWDRKKREKKQEVKRAISMAQTDMQTSFDRSKSIN